MLPPEATTNSDSGDTQPHYTIYLNVQILELTDEIRKLISEKVNKKVPNPLGYGVLGRLAGRVAVKAANKQMVSKVVAKKIPEVLPEKMKEMGIHGSFEEVFFKGNFTVIRIEVHEIDVDFLLSKAMADDNPKKAKMDTFMKIIKCLVKCFEKEDEFDDMMQNVVKKKVLKTLLEKLPAVLPEKLADKGIHVDVVAKSAEDQAAFFYEAIRLIPDLHVGTASSSAHDGADTTAAEGEVHAAKAPKKKWFGGRFTKKS